MNNREKLMDYNNKVAQANTDLKNLLDAIKTLPRSGGEMPEKGFIINEYDENGYAKKLTIFGHTTVPEFGFAGYTVNSATYYSMIVKNLEEVVLSNEVTEIGGYAFSNAPSLKTINLENVTFIDKYAFFGCKSLTISEFPENLTKISGGSFNGSTVRFKNLKNLEKIINGGFSNCNSLIQLSIPKLVYTQDQGSSTAAFYKCSNLRAVWLGDKVGSMANTTLSKYTFQGCTSLKRIFINLPRETVEKLSYYSFAFMSDESKVGIVVCNDDEGFMTQEEFDAIDWSTYTG